VRCTTKSEDGKRVVGTVKCMCAASSNAACVVAWNVQYLECTMPRMFDVFLKVPMRRTKGDLPCMEDMTMDPNKTQRDQEPKRRGQPDNKTCQARGSSPCPLFSLSFSLLVDVRQEPFCFFSESLFSLLWCSGLNQYESWWQ
jgi:hypothetical protein